MPAFLALPLCALIALAGLTVRVGFLKVPGGKTRVGLAAGPLRRQWTLSLARAEEGIALRLQSTAGERLLPLKKRGKGQVSMPLRKALRFLLRQVRAERLEARVRVNAGDAKNTVLLAAVMSGAMAAFQAARPRLPLRWQVGCAFSEPGEARLMGIFSVRVGHIMLAALLFGREYGFGRIRAWINTPSKTS